MKPKRLFILFIIGLLSTIAILALTFSLFFEKTTERQLKAYGQMALESDVLFVNTIVESTKDLLDSISMDADISRLLNYETLSASNLLTGLRRLDKYTSSSYIIDSIYIYNRRNQTVYVSSPHLPEAVYSIEDFPDFDASNILKKYSGIKNMEPIFRSFNAFYPVISEVSYLSFIRFNTLEKENDSNVIMVNIRQTMLTSLNRNSLGSNNGALIIANTDGEYKILSEENNKFNDSTIKNLLSKAKENSNDFTFEINNRSFIVCTEKIINDSALLILVADEDIMAYETRTKGYGGSIILLGILLGICTILSALLFRRIWKNNVSQLESIEKHKIQNQIMMEESKRARLLSFLNSDIALDDKDLSNQKPEQAILLLIIIDHYNKEADKNNLKEVLCKRLCALLSQNSPLFYTYENDERCALVLSSLDADKLLEIKELIQTELNITLSIFVGNECTIESLPETYELLCKFLSYRVLFGPNQIITVPMLEEREMTQYSIPQPIIKKLTEEILKLNVPEALTTLKSILDNISSASYKSSQLCLLSLYVTIDDTISKLQINNGIDKTSIAGSLIYKLSKIESLSNVYTEIEEILNQIEKSIIQNKTNRQSELISDIIKITEENYHNRFFSINTVADQLEMNPEYLGKVFKKATASSFSDFVLNLRMNKACSMLSDSDASIDEIVYAVGFGDTPYFYKLFKKINGCTPKRYRQEHTAS